jgi:hypothetical protein
VLEIFDCRNYSNRCNYQSDKDAHKFPLGPEESNLVWSMSGTEQVGNGGIDNNIK